MRSRSARNLFAKELEAAVDFFVQLFCLFLRVAQIIAPPGADRVTSFIAVDGIEYGKVNYPVKNGEAV